MIRTLHSLRFVFIMLVVMSHIIGPEFDFGGECGVSFFFVLSGFILSYAFGDRIVSGKFSSKKFLAKQLLKFYPLHLLTFFVMIALDARLGHYYSWLKMVANVLLLQSWVPSNDFYFVANGLSWFLSDLLFFYVAFPFLFYVLRAASRVQLGSIGAIVLMLYLCLALNIPQEMVNPILYASPLTRLLDFVAGILLFRLYASEWGEHLKKQIAQRSGLFTTGLELTMLAMVVASFFVYEVSPLGFRCASLFWLVVPPVIFVFAATDRSQGCLAKLFHHPAMMWLGGISFEIYMTHCVTMRLMHRVASSVGYGGMTWYHPVGLLLMLCAIIVVAYVTKCFFVDKIYESLIKYVQ